MKSKVLAAIFLLAASTIAAASLPAPDGIYAVGLRRFTLVDANRKEVVEPDAGKPRALAVTMWYPAAQSVRTPAPYASPAVAAALAGRFQLTADFVRNVASHAQDRAHASRGTFPLVLLDHGLGMVPELYTSLAENLASHGIVVVAVNHTFTSMVSESDRGTRTYSPPWPRNVERAVQGARMGEYVSTWVADDRFVLDELPRTASKTGISLSTERVVAIGHSYGGTTACAIAAVDPRVVAAVNLDGSIYPGMPDPFPVGKPLLVMTTETSTGVQKEFTGRADETYAVTVRSSNHMSFTDSPLLGDSTSEVAERAAAIRAVVTEFVAHELLNAATPILSQTLIVTRR